MKRPFLIRILMLVIVISAAAFVVAAVRADHAGTATEECAQKKDDCVQPRTHSEFLLESLTRVVLGRVAN